MHLVEYISVDSTGISIYLYTIPVLFTLTQSIPNAF